MKPAFLLHHNILRRNGFDPVSRAPVRERVFWYFDTRAAADAALAALSWYEQSTATIEETTVDDDFEMDDPV